MLRRLCVDNYKCLVGLDAHFDEFNLLIGDNGSGKSAMFGVLGAVRSLLRGTSRITDDGVLPASTLNRWQQSATQTIEIETELHGDTCTYTLEVEHDVEQGRARIRREALFDGVSLLFEFVDGDVQLYRDDHSPGPVYAADWTESALARVQHRHDNQRLARCVDYLRNSTILTIRPESVRAHSDREDPWLDSDASNLVNWYRHIVQESPRLVAAYEDALEESISDFRSMRLEKVGVATRACMVDFWIANQQIAVALDELSDGQRALMVLYGLVHLGRQHLGLLIIDEPENFLSLREIQPWLAEIEKACEEGLTQVVLASHHPELLDLVSGHAGLVLRRDSDGATLCTRPGEDLFEAGVAYSELIARGWDE